MDSAANKDMELLEVMRPEIFRYLNYRHYLKDYFDYLVSKDRKYSQRWIAQKAGLKSPQLISMIIKGDRKLSFENAQLLAFALRLTEKEEEYLLILVELEAAKNKEQQLAILDRIRFQFQNGLFKDHPNTNFEYLKKWHYAVIRELCALKDFEFSKNLVAKILDITADEAQESLDLLLQLGYLQHIDGKYHRTEPSIRADDYVSPLLMVQYHLQILEKAFQAVQLKKEMRHFDSLVIALSTRDFELVREKIRQFIREIDMFGESSSQRDDVFQLSVQFFSLTNGRAPEAKT